MSPLIIVLGIIIIVILYYIIQYYYFSTQSLVTTIKLKEATGAQDISSNSIKNPTSILYSFGTWVYVNNFSKCSLLRYKDATNTYFELKLDGNTPTLTAVVKGKNTSGALITNNVIISTNFPIQKWVHVLVSVDTAFIDCYLDGKLVISNPLTPNNQLAKGPDSTPGITFIQSQGTNPPDVYLAKVTRWENPLDPQAVWCEYSQGNGLSNSDFAVGLTVTTDDTTKNYKIYSN